MTAFQRQGRDIIRGGLLRLGVGTTWDTDDDGSVESATTRARRDGQPRTGIMSVMGVEWLRNAGAWSPREEGALT